MTSRDRILATLRSHRAPFGDAQPRPASYISVTRFALEDRVARFTSELQQRFGQVHVVNEAPQAIEKILAILENDRAVMAWDNLPLAGLPEVLHKHSVEIVTPHVNGENRMTDLLTWEKIRVGITGATAAFATTGTLALVTGQGQGRIPSLLPPVHIALLPKDRIFDNLEDWFASEGRTYLQHASSVALITGPSSTGDIEHHHVLGAHGPGTVHVIVF